MLQKILIKFYSNNQFERFYIIILIVQ